MPITTGFVRLGTDIGDNVNLVPKSYLIDRYPELAATFKQAGLWNWGLNSSGQLGDNTTTNRSSPVQTVSAGTNWKQVSQGISYTMAIKTDGTLWLWGSNYYGQLGDNTVANRSSPVQTVSAGTNWSSVADKTANNSAAIKTDGTLWLWGRNDLGQLGDNSTVRKSSPVQTVSGGTNWRQVSAGNRFVAATKTDGTLWAWGDNGNGQLGNNTTTHSSSPVQTISGGTNWKQVSCGSQHTAAIKTDGSLWLWGRNEVGQLGNNTTVSSFGATPSPVQTVSAGTNWKTISCGSSITSAIKTDGTLWMWGSNAFGALGDNSTGSKSSPIQTVSGGTNWKQVVCGDSHTAAIKTDGTLWSWGWNNSGQLGLWVPGSGISLCSSPIQTVSGGTNWKQVALSGQMTACIRDDSADPI